MILSQEEVYNFLKKNAGKWYTAEEIWGAINVHESPTLNSIRTNVLKLTRPKFSDVLVRKRQTGNYAVKEYCVERK
jgi:hypothetical protein